MDKVELRTCQEIKFTTMLRVKLVKLCNSIPHETYAV